MRPVLYTEEDVETNRTNRSVGGWLCGGFVGFENGDNFGCFPKVGDCVEAEGMIENVRTKCPC